MKSTEFIDKLLYIAGLPTAYVQSAFGAPMNAKNRARYMALPGYNANHAEIISRLSDNTFGFDCVCLIKGILWGFNGDASKQYGGAKYKSNNVPDISTEEMIAICDQVSDDFTSIEEGELVYIPGHVGVYVGGGKVVEATAKWDACVQISTLGNIKAYAGSKARIWKKHGKLPYIEYPSCDIKKHLVLKGDTLWGIAKKYYGNGAKYPVIKDFNHLTSNLIKPGQVLEIPAVRR